MSVIKSFIKNVLVIGAIIAAIFSTAMLLLASAPARAADCGFAESRLNPQTLSLYQECWLNEHKPDELSGTIGSLFWARTATGFISFPVATIAREGEARVVEYVTTKIVESVEDVKTYDRKSGRRAHIQSNNDFLARLADAAGTNGWVFEGNYGNMPLLKEIRKVTRKFIRKEVQAAYNQGYKDGFQDGYKAGYADGWNDAVAAHQ